jgi:hypothetical protein
MIMQRMRLDPLTEWPVSGRAPPSPDDHAPIAQRIAAETIDIPNRHAWEEMRTRLHAAGIPARHLREAMATTWSMRKQMRALSKRGGDVP